ncbi:MAG: phosphatase family protein [Actinomycetia bacterium]|nr:phosphatase family protein [Actinomycetes bacterium]
MSDVVVPNALHEELSRVATGHPADPLKQPPRRRPSGAPAPLPHHLRTTGLGWLIALVGVLAATRVLFHDGLHGAAIGATVIDDTIVRWVSNAHAPGLYETARVLTAVSSYWVIQILSWALPVVLLALRRWRHLLITAIVVQLAQVVFAIVQDTSARPRPFGVALRAGWGGWALPSEQIFATTGLLVIVLYALVPEGRWRNVGKWALAGVISLVALARVHLGVDAPTDIFVAIAIGVAFPVVAFRMFVPNEFFPVAYRRGRAAHLDVGGVRGVAIRTALEEQLGLVVNEIRPIGLSGSAGSTPLRLTTEGTPELYLFGKLYSKTHLRSDRWYKIGRELLYGRLEDEKPFNSVRHLVQQEDYALRLVRDAGVPSARPFGLVELTPEREYLLVTEFFDGAVELSEAFVDDSLIDDGLRIIRLLWNAGLAHRDIKPANLMVRDGKLLLIDVAFTEVRPTPWRQAVDLANMMLCLGLGSSAHQVYERARRHFTVQEISEGFAAARGLALPSQLRRALRAEGRDLHGEFLGLLPEPPRPIKVQRWTPRRLLVWCALAVVVLLLGFNYTQVFGNADATRTPLHVHNIDCGATTDLEPLLIEAQSVQTAAFVPCVRSLPVGWSVRTVYANSGRGGFTLDHDRAGQRALVVTLTKRCDIRGAREGTADINGARRFNRGPGPGLGRVDQTWYEVFPGGCVTTQLRSHNPRAEVSREAPAIVGYLTRAELARDLTERSNGRLHLDPR